MCFDFCYQEVNLKGLVAGMSLISVLIKRERESGGGEREREREEYRLLKDHLVI